MSLTPRSGRDFAQIRWGEALRRQARRRRRRRLRMVVTAVFAAIVAGSALVKPAPRLLWNASASAPVGLYRVRPGGLPRRGELVAARIAPPVARLAAERGYLALGVPVVKRVAGLPGDRICAVGHTVTINGIPVADRLPVDPAHRPLAGWTGCRDLAADQYLLLTGAVRDSFDGRYFGPSRAHDLIGPVTPLWLR